MRSRLNAWLVAFLSMALLYGAGCTPNTSGIVFVTPGSVAPTTTPSFQVEVHLADDINPATLAVTLNGDPLVVAVGLGGNYFATLNPGGNLADINTLVGTAQTMTFQPRTETRIFQWLPPKARLRKITNPADLMTGPLAHGKLGDYLLANDAARFIVQDVAQRDLHSVGAFGGNLIDLELVGHPGLENFFELQPGLNIESVLNAQTATIVNDGLNGLPAVLRVCGVDDLIDYINPSSVVAGAGGTLPVGVDDQDLDIEACTEYTLEIGKTRIRIDTTVQDLSGADQELFIGDYMNGMGELEQWTPPRTPPTVPGLLTVGVGEVTATWGNEVFSYFGFGQAQGVDYAFVGASPPTPTSSFTVSGVSYLLHGMSIPTVLFFGAASNFVVPADGQNTFTRYMGVGDGSGANAIAMQAEIQNLNTGTLRGCVTAGGAPAPGVRVSAGSTTAGLITRLRASWVTDSAGCYQGRVPTGNYGVAAAREGSPYEGGGTTPLTHLVAVALNGTTVQDIPLPATGHVNVSVIDETNSPVPGRVTIVGFDPSPEPKLTATSITGNDTTTGVFNDITKDGLNYGTMRVVYTGAAGTASFDLEPGSYQAFVSRGTEYSVYSTPITITANNTTPVNAQIAHVIQTPGFISSDYHVHAINSPDSRINNTNRSLQYAGEGVDNIIMTDHDARTDLTPVISALGLTPFVHSTVGEEITTFDYGHFNAYPLGQDPSRVSQGSTDHGKLAPPGQDFPSSGNFGMSPAEIHAAVLADPFSPSSQKVVQINHFDSHIDPLRIDTGLTPPASVLTPTEQVSFRIDPAIPNLFHAFPALEVWNGHNRSHVLCEFLGTVCPVNDPGGRIGIWMNLLNQGIISTGIADTDTHEFLNVRGGGARTWTASSTDAPAAISNDELGASVKAGRAIGGQGLYLQTRLLATDGSGGVADLTLGGSNSVTVTDDQVNLEIEVQAPLWAEYNRIEIYVNAATKVTKRNPNVPTGVPTLYTAVPTLTLNAGVDFAVSTVNDFPAIPGGQHRETTKTVTLATPLDAWVVVVVRGTDGVSKPMFPVMPANLNTAGNTTLANLLDGNLGQGGVTALGFTNALFVDANGNSTFDPPGVLVVP
jgi:hypothetical protein